MVKGYVFYEKVVFENVICVCVEILIVLGLGEVGIVEGYLQQVLCSLFVVVEVYLQLQVSMNFLQLQQVLVDIEDKIQVVCWFYNGGVCEFNIKIKVFLNNLFVKGFGFIECEFFEVVDSSVIFELLCVQF